MTSQVSRKRNNELLVPAVAAERYTMKLDINWSGVTVTSETKKEKDILVALVEALHDSGVEIAESDGPVSWDGETLIIMTS